MDEFADSLYRERVSSWSEQYIDYEELQSKVDAAAEPNQDEATCQQRKTEVESMPGSHDVVTRAQLLALCLKDFCAQLHLIRRSRRSCLSMIASWHRLIRG